MIAPSLSPRTLSPTALGSAISDRLRGRSQIARTIFREIDETGAKEPPAIEKLGPVERDLYLIAIELR
jgi:hypothetical protein